MKTTSRFRTATSGLVCLLFFAFGATANVSAQTSFTINFDQDENGGAMVAGTTNLVSSPPYENLFGSGLGVTLSTDNPGTNPLNLYNSEGTGGLDNDLERNSTGSGVWDGGNATSSVFDNLLIVNDDSNISNPDDEGSGGQMVLDFDIALTSFGFDFVDMDSAANASVTFTDTSTIVPTSVTLSFTLFETGSGSVHDVGASFGDRHANQVHGIDASELSGLSQFDQVTFDLSSSGGIGTVYVTTVPEPGSVALLLVGITALMIRRPRRV